MQKQKDPHLTMARWGVAIGFIGVVVAIIAGLPAVLDFIEKRTMAQASPVIFSCQQNPEGQWVTMPKKANSTAANPLFLWKTVEFGDNFTPEKRCQIVSDKLTQAVQKNDNDFTKLILGYGKVNGEAVICVKTEEDCNSSNMLFTLSKKDANKPWAVLDELRTFALNNGGNPSLQNGVQSEIALKDLIEFTKP